MAVHYAPAKSSQTVGPPWPWTLVLTKIRIGRIELMGVLRDKVAIVTGRQPRHRKSHREGFCSRGR